MCHPIPEGAQRSAGDLALTRMLYLIPLLVAATLSVS